MRDYLALGHRGRDSVHSRAEFMKFESQASLSGAAQLRLSTGTCCRPYPHSQGAAAAKGKHRKELVEEWMPTPKKSSTPKVASKAVATPSSGASKSTVALNSLSCALHALPRSQHSHTSHSHSLNNSCAATTLPQRRARFITHS